MSCDCEFGPLVTVPTTADGVCVNFASSELEEIEKFFKEYGFVVVRNVASPALIDGAEAELMAEAKLSQEDLVDLDKVDWRKVYGNKYNEGKGFVGYNPAIGPSVAQIRQNKAIVDIYGRLLGRRDLYAKLDRFGLMRPSKDRPHFRTEIGFVHWDQSPTIEPNFSRIQGVLTLSEHTATSGGFHCVPGFVKHFGAYAVKHPQKYDAGDLIATEGECLRERHLTRILAPRGSLIIWDSRLPHGNWPNQGSDEWRKVLYMTFFPRPDDVHLRAVRKQEMELIPSLQPMVAQLDDIGRRLFAIDDYPADMLPTAEEITASVDMDAAFSNRQNGIA
eukprot:TRINITY_DN4133_c0_g1_i1.p1 TRINITY_DN4133_c0_g1~~TRINITY_DN4133_c0_g1_i1.p1  ORF type:complete len:333 (+),score=83.56 TRINITY_DN4133_c0_g1_i1:1166-2164(+)